MKTSKIKTINLKYNAILKTPLLKQVLNIEFSASKRLVLYKRLLLNYPYGVITYLNLVYKL